MCVQTGVRSSELAEQAGVRSHPPPRCGCFHRGRVDSGARFLAIRPHVGLLIREDPAAAAGGFFAFFAIFFALPVSSPSEESVSESVSYSSPKSFSEEGDDENWQGYDEASHHYAHHDEHHEALAHHHRVHGDDGEDAAFEQEARAWDAALNQARRYVCSN